MEKFYKLNKPLYHNVDHIRLSCKYDKKIGGYVAQVEAITHERPGLYGKMFCKEYYETGGDGYYMLVESGKRNAKREELANGKLAECPEKYLKMFLDHFNQIDLQYQETII